MLSPLPDVLIGRHQLRSISLLLGLFQKLCRDDSVEELDGGIRIVQELLEQNVVRFCLLEPDTQRLAVASLDKALTIVGLFTISAQDHGFDQVHHTLHILGVGNARHGVLQAATKLTVQLKQLGFVEIEQKILSLRIAVEIDVGDGFLPDFLFPP